MQRKLFLLLLISALLPALVFASGKIRGKVTDAGTGEALVGANVVIIGTSMGAATNVTGEYVILNVPVGTYTLRTSYVGYQTITISNIRLNNELTSEANFALPAEGVTVGTVEIIAERPLINKSATNAVRIIDSEFFDKLPARGTNAAIGAQPGVVIQADNIYIRGGRPDEVGYRVEGVSTTDVINGGSALYTTAEAVEQMQIQAGGYSAEFGGANAGIVQSQLRSGSSERWRGNVLFETDNYTSQNKKALGGYSYGYSDVTLTVGGPISGKNLRFFGSAQNTFFRDPLQVVREPYRFVNKVTDNVITPLHGGTRGDTLSVLSNGGNSIGGMSNRWAISGTVLWDMGNLKVRGAGSWSALETRTSTTFPNILNTARLALNQSKNGFGNLKLSYIISPTTFLEVNGNYFTQTAKSMDPHFKDNVMLYGDSAANAALGFRLYREGQNYNPYSFYNGAISGLNQPGTQLAGFSKSRNVSIGGRADFTTQLKVHELKVGGEYTRYTLRRYFPSGVRGWSALSKTATSAQALEVVLNKTGVTGSDLLGYDIFGNVIDGDVFKNGALFYLGPRHPVFAAMYVQDKIEFSDIIMNLGLRWDYIDPNSVDTPKPGTLAFNPDDFILAEYYTSTPKTSQVSPRIGFSFPVSDRTVFHAQYGKFIQQSRLNDSYRGSAYISGIIKSGAWVTTPSGWGLRPERTTQYELGISQALSEAASFDITAFYRDIQDQIQFIKVTPDITSVESYAGMANADFSTAKGLEIRFVLRRSNRVSAMINYTFMDARSTASDQSGSNGIWQLGLPVSSLPRYVFPTNFDYTQNGNIILDYRFGKNDGGPVFEQSGANVFLTFNSGHALTRLIADQRGTAPGDERFRQPIEPIGSSTTPWFFQLDARLDKTVMIGPLDVNFYVYVINLLGTDNAVDAFFRTNDPQDDGWFSTAAGQSDLSTLGPGFEGMYRELFLGRNSGNYGPPRQFRFGIRLDL